MGNVRLDSKKLQKLTENIFFEMKQNSKKVNQQRNLKVL